MAEIKSVQRGTTVILTSGTTATATITAVDTTKAYLIFSNRVNSGATDESALSATSGYISSTTQISFARGTSGGTTDDTISWMVVEYHSGVSVQRGVLTSLNASTSPTSVTLTAVTVSRSWAIMRISSDASWNYGGDQLATSEITSSTNLNIVSESPSDPEGFWRWEVVDHSDASVQKVTGTQASPTLTTSATITAVNMAKTFIVGTLSRSTAVMDMVYGVNWLLYNTTTIRLIRTNGFSDNSYVIYAVSLSKNVSVQRGETTNTGSTTFTQNISAINLNTSYIQLLGPNNHIARATASGTSDVLANKIEAKFNSATQINFQRDYAAADTYSSMSWEVIDLNADSILNISINWIPRI